MQKKIKIPEAYFPFPSRVTLKHLNDVVVQTAFVKTPSYVIDEMVLEDN